ncbi:MAG: hypothetical protein L3J74_06350 [Bacteroidales bacterium]|nr:hypothetical protein [Bacteroidales bacterium]
MSNKTLHPKAKHALNAALAGIVIMVSILFAHLKWVLIAGTFLSFGMSIFTMSIAIQSLRLINRNKDTYRGDNMAWIALILGILIFLMTIPFVIQFVGVVLKN